MKNHRFVVDRDAVAFKVIVVCLAVLAVLAFAKPVVVATGVNVKAGGADVKAGDAVVKTKAVLDKDPMPEPNDDSSSDEVFAGVSPDGADEDTTDAESDDTWYDDIESIDSGYYDSYKAAISSGTAHVTSGPWSGYTEVYRKWLANGGTPRVYGASSDPEQLLSCDRNASFCQDEVNSGKGVRLTYTDDEDDCNFVAYAAQWGSSFSKWIAGLRPGDVTPYGTVQKVYIGDGFSIRPGRIGTYLYTTAYKGLVMYVDMGSGLSTVTSYPVDEKGVTVK